MACLIQNPLLSPTAVIAGTQNCPTPTQNPSPEPISGQRPQPIPPVGDHKSFGPRTPKPRPRSSSRGPRCFASFGKPRAARAPRARQVGSYVSVGHSVSLEAFHTQKLVMERRFEKPGIGLQWLKRMFLFCPLGVKGNLLHGKYVFVFFQGAKTQMEAGDRSSVSEPLRFDLGPPPSDLPWGSLGARF